MRWLKESNKKPETFSFLLTFVLRFCLSSLGVFGTPRISVVEKELKTKYQHLCIIDLIISSIISNLKLAAFFHLVVHCHFKSWFLCYGLKSSKCNLHKSIEIMSVIFVDMMRNWVSVDWNIMVNWNWIMYQPFWCDWHFSGHFSFC